MYIGLHVRNSMVLPDFNVTWIFSTDVLNNTQIQNFMKISPMGAKLFQADRADGQTDRHEEAYLVAFCNFVNTPTVWISTVKLQRITYFPCTLLKMQLLVETYSILYK